MKVPGRSPAAGSLNTVPEVRDAKFESVWIRFNKVKSRACTARVTVALETARPSGRGMGLHKFWAGCVLSTHSAASQSFLPLMALGSMKPNDQNVASMQIWNGFKPGQSHLVILLHRTGGKLQSYRRTASAARHLSGHFAASQWDQWVTPPLLHGTLKIAAK